VTLHVACAASELYVQHCAAMLHSLFVQNPGREIEVYFLHSPDFAPDYRTKLRSLVESKQGNIRFFAIEDAAVSQLPTMARIPPVGWYRVFLPQMLPSLDRILYLDADTLVVDQLDPLWETPLADAYVAAVSNVFEPQYAHRPRELGLPDSQDYFNSGVLLFNLEKMRADDCTHRIVEFARGRDLLWVEQDALNVVLGTKRVPLHPRWNCMNSLFFFPQARQVFGSEVVRQAIRTPAIVHFEGPELAKPWHYLSRHPYRRTYKRHRSMTPWPDIVVEGRTWPNRLLKPLPTRVAIAAQVRWARLKPRLTRSLGRMRPMR
jgi:lipopolysaccharide biosynthesis glycosyltransferase